MGIDIVAGAAIAGVILLLWISSATNQVKRANEKVKREVEAVGVTYDQNRAGKPFLDGCILIILSLVFAVVATALLGYFFVPLP